MTMIEKEKRETPAVLLGSNKSNQDLGIQLTFGKEHEYGTLKGDVCPAA